MTENQQEVSAWIGRTAVDSEGDKIGKIDEIYLDLVTGQPEWLTVTTGWFGTKQTFVPLAGATVDGDDLRLAFTKDKVKDAPKIDTDDNLESEQAAELYRHYGRQADFERSTAAQGAADQNPATMTRSEEEVAVDTRSHESGKARLRKYVVTENITMTVPIRKEKVELVREPITDSDGPAGEISAQDQTMVLHEEEPVIQKRVVAKETVRMDKDVEVEEQEVTAEVRKEQVELDLG